METTPFRNVFHVLCGTDENQINMWAKTEMRNQITSLSFKKQLDEDNVASKTVNYVGEDGD